MGHLEHGCGIIIARHNGGRDVITHHEPLRGERCPCQIHGSGQVLCCTPTGSAISGGDEADFELTCGGSGGRDGTAIRVREVVVGQSKMGRATRRAPIDGQARDQMINATPNWIDRNALG